MQPEVLSLTDLTVSYGRVQALRGVSFDIASDSGIVGLFGPNGAGKSTTIRVLVGDIQRYGGSARIPERSRVAYLPDKPFLYRWMRVSQCADLFSSRYPDFRGEVFREFLDESGITGASRVSSLSKGMSERLHLALTMARHPDVYVLDEPLAAVDPVARDRLIDSITRLRAPGAPVLLSTHLIQGLDRIFDSVVMISGGRTLITGDLETVRSMGDGDLETAYKRIVTNHE